MTVTTSPDSTIETPFDEVMQEAFAAGEISDDEYALVYSANVGNLDMDGDGFLTIEPFEPATRFQTRVVEAKRSGADMPAAGTDPVGYAAFHSYLAINTILYRLNQKI